MDIVSIYINIIETYANQFSEKGVKFDPAAILQKLISVFYWMVDSNKFRKPKSSVDFDYGHYETS